MELPLLTPATVSSKLFHVAYTAFSIIIGHLPEQVGPVIIIHLIGTVLWFVDDLSGNFPRTFAERQSFHPSLSSDEA